MCVAVLISANENRKRIIPDGNVARLSKSFRQKRMCENLILGEQKEKWQAGDTDFLSRTN